MPKLREGISPGKDILHQLRNATADRAPSADVSTACAGSAAAADLPAACNRSADPSPAPATAVPTCLSTTTASASRLGIGRSDASQTIDWSESCRCQILFKLQEGKSPGSDVLLQLRNATADRAPSADVSGACAGSATDTISVPATNYDTIPRLRLY